METKKSIGLNSWLEIPKNTDFPLENIPFGIIEPNKAKPRVATRIGDFIIDIRLLSEMGYLGGIGIEIGDLDAFRQSTLNELIGLGKEKTTAIRNKIIELFSVEDKSLQNRYFHIKEIVKPISEFKVLMPLEIPDYTDFYSSEYHAINVGKMFRDEKNPLLPNWKHMPIAYHGRSSSIVVSGTEIHRPQGQVFDDQSKKTVFGPTKMLDFELEMAFVIGKNSVLGESIPIDKTEEYIFGMVVFNDLSARDHQRWEYQPLGPFLGKNFGSVISPWVVTMDALESFRTETEVQSPAPLPYLTSVGKRNFDINLEVSIKPKGLPAEKVCKSNFKYLYWNMCQQLAHHTVNGCNVRVGDLIASGTISGPENDSFGSLMELTWNGKNPINIGKKATRTFLEDNDTVIMKAFAEKNKLRIGFGECVTTILPPK